MPIRTLLVAACVGTLAISCTQTGTTATTRASTLPAALAPTKTLPEVIQSAKADLTWIADDAREGRGLGTKGLAETGDFIAARFKKLGLVPAASNGDYFEPFDFDAGNEVAPGTKLVFKGKPLKLGEDFTSFTNSKPGDVKDELAFVGYGITAPDKEYDDYAGIDVKGRVVLAMRWEPVDEDGKSRWEKRGDYTSNAAISRKAEAAAKAGAAALILVNAPTHHADAEKLMNSRGGLRRRAPLPVFHITTATAARLLAESGEDLIALQKQIDESGKPASRTLAHEPTIDAKVELAPARNAARNVVAMLPGKGPHADEYIVVGAHYDHVGRGEYGSRSSSKQIHNGADDNGSGTTALLQIAEEFALAGRQDRSIIFASFTLEEMGLIGSEKFVEHLPVPKEKIVGMLNLDMVGRMRNEFVYVGGAGTADAYDSILKAADDRSPIELKNMGKGGTGPSDHLSFSKAKIPVLFLYTGSHSDYHTPTDDVEKINFEGIAQVTYLAFDIVRSMCAMDKPAYVDRFDNMEPDTDVMAGEQPTTRRASFVIRTRVSLGIEPDASADQSIKGVTLAGIIPDSAAAAAGLQANDVIVKMNERQIDNLYDLTGFLGEEKPGDVVKVTVLRAGAPLTVDATLKARGR
jgi:hypothetical protein